MLNMHIHYVNGITITHSHPNKGEHTHSNAEILLLNRLSVFYSLKATYSTYCTSQQFILYIIEPEQENVLIINPYWDSSALRAPPVYF